MSILGPILKAAAARVRWLVDEYSSSVRAILFLAVLLHGTASFANEEGDNSAPKKPAYRATIERDTSAKTHGNVPIDLHSAQFEVFRAPSLYDDGNNSPYDGVRFALVPEQTAAPLIQETVPLQAQLPFSAVLELEHMSQRIEQLEETRVAHEDATRTIIKNSLSARGSYITDAVIFGGTVEVLSGWAEDFSDVAESDIILETTELDFEILVNEWTLGSLIIEYDDGSDFGLLSSEEDEIFVERINVDTADITIGNTQRFPLYTTLGRIVVPFGISTGDPVTDALTIIDPLTLEVFETKEDVWLIGFAYPSYCPPPPPTSPPRKYLTPRPLLLSPLVSRITRRMPCYRHCRTKPKVPATFTRSYLNAAPFTGGIYFYNGKTNDGDEDHIKHMGGTLGYRTRGCSRFGNVPWSLDIDVDVNSSAFDSDFLQFEYRRFLSQIGFVTGMAAHAKGNFGPTSWILEWNGVVSDTVFQDDLSQNHTLRPEAWQVQIAYQFDWNSAVEVIGAQGTYFVLGYSESQDLAGVTREIDMVQTRVGFVPRKRFLVGLGEWVLDGLRVAVEYSHAVDYDLNQGGTGNTADGFFMQLTYEW